MGGSSPKGNSFSLPSTDPELGHQFSARLVGKLVQVRKFNFKALSAVLTFAWKLGDRVTFPPLHQGFLLCNFVCSEDLEYVLQLGSWNFCGSLIVFQRWAPDCVFDELVFDSVDIWVHALNLPQCNLNVANAVYIGDFIGSFLSVDLGTKNCHFPLSYLRIKVQISVSKRLLTDFFLERVDKPRMWIQFQYERLTDLCYHCGSLYHVEATCPCQVAKVYGSLDPGDAFGPWLRVGFNSLPANP